MKKRRLFKALLAICLILILSTSAFASSSIYDQMAANSAAWWVAYNAGDTATCDALHQANNELAEALASSGSETSYDDESGSWTITTGDQTVTSSSYSDGHSNYTSYTSYDDDNGYVPVSNSSSFSQESIQAFINANQEATGNSISEAEALVALAYNKVGESMTSEDNYGSLDSKTSAREEAIIAQLLLGLTDSQRDNLQEKLELYKSAYENASAIYFSDTATDAEKAAALAEMNKNHNDAVYLRSSYGYKADADGSDDGSRFYSSVFSDDPSSGGIETFIIG